MKKNFGPRYFIVSYSAQKDFSGGHTIGDISISTNDGKFLNGGITRKQIIDMHPEQGFTNVVITTILEVNKIDFDTWNADTKIENNEA